MCSLALSEQTVRFIQVMTTLPAEMHEKIGVFIKAVHLIEWVTFI